MRERVHVRALGDLLHNPKNAVTASIERVAFAGGTAVRKVLNARNTPQTPAEWRASGMPGHWNYWRREYEVYASEVNAWLDGSGVRLPQLLAAETPDADTVVLLLEDVEGRTGAALELNDYADIAAAWGRAQACLSRRPEVLRKPWISRQFVRQYTASKPVDYSLLERDQVWHSPLIQDTWPAGLRARLKRLYSQREALLRVLEQAPAMPSHLDFWPHNVVLQNSGVLVPLDWSFFGAGAPAEDIGNFIPDSTFDGFMPPEVLPEMTERLLQAYLSGLAEGGAPFDAHLARHLLYASAVKYVWLGPLLLARAGVCEHSAYGGVGLADASDQYRARGATLAFLCSWAEQLLDA